jgi:predicted nuclease with TOPRIM domain
MKEKEVIKQLEGEKLRLEKENMRLKEESLKLKMSLGEIQLSYHALESLIEVVDIHYQTDVKKNFGRQQSHAVHPKRRKM